MEKSGIEWVTEKEDFFQILREEGMQEWAIEEIWDARPPDFTKFRVSTMRNAARLTFQSHPLTKAKNND